MYTGIMSILFSCNMTLFQYIDIKFFIGYCFCKLKPVCSIVKLFKQAAI